MAVKAAGLVDTLESPGPFTVFAPTNEAFNKLPAGTVETLLKPENKDQLTKILSYHVVSGRVSASDLAKQIKAGGGKTTLKTVNGETLTATMRGKSIVLTDEKGGNSMVTIANVSSRTALFTSWIPFYCPTSLLTATLTRERRKAVLRLFAGRKIRILRRGVSAIRTI